MKKDIKAIIFDMDGVLIDSEPIHSKAEREICREFGMDVPEKEWDNFRGKKLEDTFAYVVKKYGKENEPIVEMMEKKIQRYLDYALSEMQLIEGVGNFLSKLRNIQKYRYAPTTSGRKSQQDQILAKFKLTDFFPIMITADDVKHGKPHPEPYLITTEKLGEKPEDCLVIEDSDNGVISAKAAGCQICGITTTFSGERLREVGADFIVADYAQLAQILF